jgi:hypothetical protein
VLQHLERPSVAGTQLAPSLWIQRLRSGGGGAARPRCRLRAPSHDGWRRSTSWRAVAPIEAAGAPPPASRRDYGGVCRPPPSWPLHRVGQDRWGRAPVDDLERGGAERSVEGGVVAVLRPREPIHPRTRSITCNTTQVHSSDWSSICG